MQDIESAIESLKTKANELKQRISMCRKGGVNTKLAELKILNIPSKIRMAEATKDFADVGKVQQIMADADADIRELEKELAEMRIKRNA